MATDIFQVPDAPANYDLTGKKIMVHDLSQPAASSTITVDADKLAGTPQIPQPFLRYFGNDDLMVHSAGMGSDWLNHNPEIFLFRHKSQRAGRHKKNGWVHPADAVNGTTKWLGWNYYSGGRFDASGYPMNGLLTEAAIPPDWDGRMIKFKFNRFVFWNDGQDTADSPPSGLGGDWAEFNTATAGYIIGQGNRKPNLSKRYGRMAKIQKFRIAFAIDNDKATKENGLTPKIFGPMSDVFFTMPGYSVYTNGIGMNKGRNLDGLSYSGVANDIIVRIGAPGTHY